MLNAALYFHTLRYLRPVQLYRRLWYKFYHPIPDLSPPPAIRPLSGVWRVPARKSPSIIAPIRFRFLNEEHDILSATDWNRPDWSKLWLYNLHYFNELNTVKDAERLEWYRSLITRWVAENPPGVGNGWEPYPLSMRIVNWIKLVLAGNALPWVALESLAVQTRFLAKRMEFHLLGNHLIANAKALMFAGLFFKGEEAEGWFGKGSRILSRELHEQILEDGGHFELSPMYHSIILEDLLDLVNLIRCYSNELFLRGDGNRQCHCEVQKRRGNLGENECVIDARNGVGRNCNTSQAANGSVLFAEIAQRMLAWLKIISHPDGQIALFNDAASGIAAPPDELAAYAERLGLHETVTSLPGQAVHEKSHIEIFSFGSTKLTHLKDSGYIRAENGPMTALLDVAPIGPNYLPGHAHADTLSFEMSLYGRRLIVDSGTSRYDEGHDRLRQRGTAAHNTIAIDGKDSSEVWGSFRVARRAMPFGLDVKEEPDGSVVVRCAHDGYRRLPGKPIHWREWLFEDHSLAVRDVIEGRFFEAVGRFYFHPTVKVIFVNSASQGEIKLFNGSKINWHISKGNGNIINSKYHPEFGMSCQNQCLEIQLSNNESHIIFSWNE